MPIQDLAGNYGLLPDYVEPEPAQTAPVTMAEAAPVALPPAAAAPAVPSLPSLSAKYSGNVYAPEMRQAAKRVESEQAAFDELVRRSLADPAEKPSQAEMYFRLAAAFGTPTKTGGFSESLALAGKELSDYLKENRATEAASRANKLKTMLESRKISLQAAREELQSLRTLAAEEIKAGGAQSPAGKQAVDEGLTPGTPEYQKRVREIQQTGVDARLAQVNVALAGLQLREKEATKLTPGEVKLKAETEDDVSAADSALDMLKRAYALNPKTFDASLGDTIQRKALEAAGSKDPKVIATRELDNLLGQQALAKLRTAFGGNPTEGERKIMLELQGIGAKSIEERAIVIRNAYSALKARRDSQQRRLNDIKAGAYRSTGEQSPGTEGDLQ